MFGVWLTDYFSQLSLSLWVIHNLITNLWSLDSIATPFNEMHWFTLVCTVSNKIPEYL